MKRVNPNVYYLVSCAIIYNCPNIQIFHTKFNLDSSKLNVFYFNLICAGFNNKLKTSIPTASLATIKYH